MTRDNNPLEIGLRQYCTLDGSIDFIGIAALQAIADRGVAREIRGVVFEGAPCPPCGKPWPVMAGPKRDVQVGQITSAAYSPRLECNVGPAIIARDYWEPGQTVVVHSVDGRQRTGRISALPFA